MGTTLTNPTLVPFGFGTPVQVLLVEGDSDDAALIHAQVSEDADTLFHVEWKDTILNAIRRLAEPGIDVVLLDLGMPELSGYKTHLAVSTVTKKTPIVIFTADDTEVSRDITSSQGAFRYLVKGQISPVELRQALHEAALSGLL